MVQYKYCGNVIVFSAFRSWPWGL